MKVKTSDLIGPALNWALGKALGLPVEICQIFQYGRPNGRHYISIGETDRDGAEVDFDPSQEWSQGGPLIEYYWVELQNGSNLPPDLWGACMWSGTDAGVPLGEGWGLTPLVAATRCIVASKLGDEVDVPEELLK
jgi:hypothetical protein